MIAYSVTIARMFSGIMAVWFMRYPAIWTILDPENGVLTLQNQIHTKIKLEEIMNKIKWDDMLIDIYEKQTNTLLVSLSISDGTVTGMAQDGLAIRIDGEELEEVNEHADKD